MSYKQWRNHVRNFLRVYQAGESKSLFYWYLKTKAQSSAWKRKLGNIGLIEFDKYSWRELYQIFK